MARTVLSRSRAYSFRPAFNRDNEERGHYAKTGLTERADNCGCRSPKLGILSRGSGIGAFLLLPLASVIVPEVTGSMLLSASTLEQSALKHHLQNRRFQRET